MYETVGEAINNSPIINIGPTKPQLTIKLNLILNIVQVVMLIIFVILLVVIIANMIKKKKTNKIIKISFIISIILFIGISLIRNLMFI